MAERGPRSEPLIPREWSRRELLQGLAVGAAFGCVAMSASAARTPPPLNAVRQWLPGRYESANAELFVVPIYAPRAGEHVFYLRQSLLDDPDGALSQSLLAASTAKRNRCVLQEWRLLEPRRWRDGHVSPDLFKSLVPDDLAPGPAALVGWDPTVTRVVSVAGSAFRFELDPTALTLTERYERR
jgi:hypothetical protein